MNEISTSKRKFYELSHWFQHAENGKNHGKIRVLSKPVNNICIRVEFIADIFFIHSQEPDQNDLHILLLIKESTAFDDWDPFTNRD